MSVLDPQLLFVKEGGADDVIGDAALDVAEMGLSLARGEGAADEQVFVSVLVQHAGDPAELERAGLQIGSVVGDVITGSIAIGDLAALEAIDDIERVEASRPLQSELDLSLAETRADLVHAGPPGRRGAGVIVGIVDTGCDFRHPSFRHSDGSSRILALWDQNLSPAGGESRPGSFSYGVEYTKEDIDTALAATTPTNIVRHTDPATHGTHVAGIAAGDGSVAGQGLPAGTFVGVAPEADLIIVAVRGNGQEGFGTSVGALDAVNYVYRKAAELDKAAVVNMSLGDNLGPHDGTSLLERGLDNLLGAEGRAFVKSAGNAGAARIHAQGNATPTSAQEVRFFQPSTSNPANFMDLWYDGRDRLRVSVTDPGGASVGPVTVGSVSDLAFPSGNRVRIDHRGNDPFNDDKRVFMTFTPGTAASGLTSGQWRLRIEALSAPSGGRFDVWVQRSRRPIPEFLSPHESRAVTISTPGTAREVITAANYRVRGSAVGTLAASSSRGPSRDGRPAPTLAAPGGNVISARSGTGGDPYVSLSGTSMSAPHITGAIALMFQKNRRQTQAQIKACLERTARADASTGPTPNTAWGAGKLDAHAAVNCVRGAGFPPLRTVVPVRCPSVVVVTCPSRPRTTCTAVSVPILRCPSRVVFCQQSVVTVCPSLVRTSCQPPSRPRLCNFPSVVDGCPSTPGGCRILRPREPEPTRIEPGRAGLGRGDVSADEDTGARGATGAPEDDWQMPYVDEASGEGESPWEDVEVPEQGYFDYEEGWFDAEE